MANVVHYAIIRRDGGVTPLCGDWTAGTSWTTVPDAVRCPRCAARLRAMRRGAPNDARRTRPVASA